jgi:hypothetical protein
MVLEHKGRKIFPSTSQYQYHHLIMVLEHKGRKIFPQYLTIPISSVVSPHKSCIWEIYHHRQNMEIGNTSQLMKFVITDKKTTHQRDAASLEKIR